VSLLSQIEELRDVVSGKIAEKRNPPPPPEGITAEQVDEAIRYQIEGLEGEIDRLIVKRAALPDCPFRPCTGKMEETPTKRVLKCDKCSATALPGREDAITHVPARSG
jgi:hypothetical protein